MGPDIVKSESSSFSPIWCFLVLELAMRPVSSDRNSRLSHFFFQWGKSPLIPVGRSKILLLCLAYQGASCCHDLFHPIHFIPFLDGIQVLGYLLLPSSYTSSPMISCSFNHNLAVKHLSLIQTVSLICLSRAVLLLLNILLIIFGAAPSSNSSWCFSK